MILNRYYHEETKSYLEPSQITLEGNGQIYHWTDNLLECEEVTQKVVVEHGISVNSLEFYEGDLVQSTSVHPFPWEEPNVVGKVEFLEGAFMIVQVDSKTAIPLWSEHRILEVIGNIHGVAI